MSALGHCLAGEGHAHPDDSMTSTSDCPGSTTRVTVERAGCVQVFNLPLSEAHLVVDVRSPDAYEKAHLTGAWLLFPAVCSALSPLFDDIEDHCPPEQLDTVLVCCNPGQDVADVCAAIASSRPLLDSDEESRFSFRSRLKSRLRRIFVFDGVEDFATSFPFLITAGRQPFPENGLPPPLPALAHPGDRASGRAPLYLGSWAHVLNLALLQHLGISSILNAAIELPNGFEQRGDAPDNARDCPRDADKDGRPEKPKPNYLKLDLVDSMFQDLHPSLEHSFEFLQTKGPGTGRPTLVHCARGHNRLAALVAHYLMRIHAAATPEEAIDTVRQMRGRGTLSNNNFVTQLCASDAV